jgi:hypothetical protein
LTSDEEREIALAFFIIVWNEGGEGEEEKEFL